MRPRNGASGDGLNGVVATILLQDDASGLPLAVVDGTFLTGMRTAAGSAAVADVMVQEGATRLAVFGAGLQARLLRSLRESGRRQKRYAESSFRHFHTLFMVVRSQRVGCACAFCVRAGGVPRARHAGGPSVYPHRGDRE